MGDGLAARGLAGPGLGLLGLATQRLRLLRRAVPLSVRGELFFDERGLSPTAPQYVRHYWEAKADLDRAKLVQARDIFDDKLEQNQDLAELRAGVSLAKKNNANIN